MNLSSTNILVVSIVDPFLHRGGAGSVTRSLLNILSHPPIKAHFDYLIVPNSSSITFHRLRQITSVFKSLISPLPSKVIFTYSNQLKNQLKESLRNKNYDLVIINGTDLLWISEEVLSFIPKVLIAHNIEHQLFNSQIESLRKIPLLNNILQYDYKCLREYEMSGIQEINNVVFLSCSEEEFVLKNIGYVNSLVVPPLFNYEVVQRKQTPCSNGFMNIGFIGNFNWWPNLQGIDWFLNKVFAFTKERLIFHIFGEGSQHLKINNNRVIKHGFIDDIQDVWNLLDLVVCPVFSGGGVNVKFSEAIYNRLPVLATPFAARGLSLEPEPGIVLMSNEYDWINFLNSLTPGKLKELSISDATSQKFSIDSQLQHVQNFFVDLIQDSFTYDLI